MYTSFTQLKSS